MTSYPPVSTPVRAVQVTFALPGQPVPRVDPNSIVGFAGDFGKVFGVSKRVFVDQALATTPVNAFTWTI